MSETKERRERILRIDEQEMVAMLNCRWRHEFVAFESCEAMPDGTRVVGVQYSLGMRCFEMLVSHPSFGVVPDGAYAPHWPAEPCYTTIVWRRKPATETHQGPANCVPARRNFVEYDGRTLEVADELAQAIAENADCQQHGIGVMVEVTPGVAYPRTPTGGWPEDKGVDPFRNERESILNSEAENPFEKSWRDKEPLL